MMTQPLHAGLIRDQPTQRIGVQLWTLMEWQLPRFVAPHFHRARTGVLGVTPHGILDDPLRESAF